MKRKPVFLPVATLLLVLTFTIVLAGCGGDQGSQPAPRYIDYAWLKL